MTLIVGGDIETTGLEIGDHRIIEIYAGLWDLATREKVDEINLRINPQRSIAVDAQRVHGISLADLQHAPIWDRVAEDVHAFLSRGHLIVGHNWKSFDGPFLDHEFKRVGLTPITVPVLDTMRNGRWATQTGKVPSLGELCVATNVTYEAAKAHAADYDVDVMMQAFFRGLDWQFFKIKESVLAA